MAEASVHSVFSYGYRPLHPSHYQDGGFTVNLYNNDLLAFATYDTDRHCLQELFFPLQPVTCQRYLRLADYARPWLCHVPPLMQPYEDAVGEYSFGFHQIEIFRILDIVQLMDCPFGNACGHYARMAYSLLEDVATLLLPYGIQLLPSSFSWNNEILPPLPASAVYGARA